MSTAAAVSSRQVGQAAKQRVKNGMMKDYKQLSKFKLSSLVVMTAGAGFVAGSGSSIDWMGFLLTSLGTFGCAACANTLNQMYEVANDQMMSRTCNRPLPAGRMGLVHAAAFAAVMGACGIATLYYQANPTTALLGASNIALYAGVYTPLKQVTIANTWVGAVVGAIPPLMGWSAAAGQLEAGAWILAGALFSWQMPHFLALAWLCKDDYIRGGFNMISRMDLSGRRTALAALRHCAYLAPLGLLAYVAGSTTQPFAWEAAGLSAVLGVYATRFAMSPSQQSARKLFKMSLLYLPLLLLGMGVHRQPNPHMSMDELQGRLVALSAGLWFDPWGSAVSALDALNEGVNTLADRISEGLLTTYIKCPSKVLCEAEAETEEAEGGRKEGQALQRK
eukprot:CAMPEP_0202901196 /NCGR_PEP_ID=MMETSP1392-20130828/13881_1 /ASSEMBLY_ACC=CAM_ASM_000868 /TAXON_ID=225041 /ORGANISM="Chlamydomonas chlamydogama, Strain SAG 11-48b" /LENGTH=391 /DNA_ID=CAMNT_0049587717 /DNA_START=459 /DNA_END=1634 /DNA_ORIENTATION=-